MPCAQSAPRAGPACEGAADIALFLPFDCSKGRQRAAKPGIKRNPKIAKFFAG